MSSVKVAVRLRPFNNREKESKSILCVDMQGKSTVIRDDLGQEKAFGFDYSFWSHDGFTQKENGYLEPSQGESKYVDQKKVYELIGTEVLRNAYQGYNCCLFAYGQTGSGKSYSMVGYGSNKGIVPMICDELFHEIKKNTTETLNYEITISMLEIYNEKVYDLLVSRTKSPSSSLKIRENKALGIYVEGLTSVAVSSYDEIEQMMNSGYENRTIGSTLMNSTSSRAHTIISIEYNQIEEKDGSKTRKTSSIKLVDLAGSEKASATGATGDQLKEGCNINRSLLTLGYVISILADKSSGKKKDFAVPYRDSSLTRILQNALGGNSKTIMICALSPASINYDETLSTLRFADRAKNIKTTAVVNEGPHEKSIRLLKEENLELKKQIEKLTKSVSQGVGEVDKELYEIKDQYDANTRVMENLTKTFEEKMKESRSHLSSTDFMKAVVDVNFPHLVNLNEDPQLCFKLKYSLKSLPFFIGRKDGNPRPHIVLSGIGIRKDHAFFKEGTNIKGSSMNQIIIKANDPEAKDFLFVNGKKIDVDNGQILKHKDRITFGTNVVFVFLEKAVSYGELGIDWDFAFQELQKEIELNLRLKEKEAEEKKAREFERLREELEDKYKRERALVEDKLKEQAMIYEEKVKDLKQSVEKTKIEAERKHMETLLQERLNNIEHENQKKKKEYEIREKSELTRRQKDLTFKKTMKHNSEKLDLSLTLLMRKINKMKIILSEFQRRVDLEVRLVKNMENYLKHPKTTQTQIQVRVENYEEGHVYYWSTETFQTRYDMLKDLFERYQDEDDFDIKSIKKEEDPMWDEPKPTLIGVCFYKLEPLIYLMGNQVSCSIVSPVGDIAGTLTIDIIPYNDNDLEFEEVPDSPEDLIGEHLNYRIYIKEAQGLPENICTNCYVEYKPLFSEDEVMFRTNISDGKKRNPKFEESFHHFIEYITREHVDLLTKERMFFYIYGMEEVETNDKYSQAAKQVIGSPMKVDFSEKTVESQRKVFREEINLPLSPSRKSIK